MSDHELVFERYVEPTFLIVYGTDIGFEVVGVVTNEVEFLRILVQIKQKDLYGYSLMDPVSGKSCPILSQGRIKKATTGFDIYPETDKLMKELMGF
jgi:hypothetical protein